MQEVRSSSGGGGGGGGGQSSRIGFTRNSGNFGDDFTERVEASEFRPIEAAPQSTSPAGVARFRSTADDFTSRVTGGEFRPAAAPGQRSDAGRVSGGRSNDFTGRFEAGDFISTGGNQGGARGTTGFPLAGVPGASRNGQGQGDFNSPLTRGMSNDDSTSSSIRIPFTPSSSGSSDMQRPEMLPSRFFDRPGEARRSSLGNRF